MFDWNDEAIANIIWGEAGESGDGVVPYPDRGEEDGHKKFQNQESLGIKPAEHRLSGAKLDFQGIRSERSPASGKNGRISASGMESWLNVATSQVAETDHSSLDDSVFSDSVLISKYSSKEECQLDGDSGAYVNLHGKDLSDFGEYGWENIGSFDDLDRIFSNDEPLFSSVTVGNPDEIWSSSFKQNKKSPPKSFDSPVVASKSFLETSGAVQLKSKYGRSGQSIDLSFGTMDDSASLTFQQKSEMPDIAGDGEDERKPNLAVEVKNRQASSHVGAENILTLNEFADKVYGQENHLKVQKKVRGKAKGKSSQRFNSGCSLPANTSGFYKHQLPSSLPQACLPFSLSQRSQAEGPEAFNYQLIPHSYMTTSAFANYANPVAAMHPSVCYQPGELKRHTVFPGYEVTSADVDTAGKQLDSPGRAPPMTPREKIEKLRRRQQMQAMLAIQNQLQQFGSQVSPNASQKGSLESLNQLKPGPIYEVDNLSALPSLDIASSIEQDESSPLSAAADGYSIEEAVLQRLQDAITKLDVPIRISIRDSLFRLATSALQRQKTSDMNISNARTMDQHGAVDKDDHDDSKREVKVTDSETDTNPIDRAVAHLLFHRPVDLLIKHPETPESSMSTKLNMEQQAHSGANQAVDSGRSSKTSLDFSFHRVGNTCQQHVDGMDASHPYSDHSALAAGGPEGGASR